MNSPSPSLRRDLVRRIVIDLAVMVAIGVFLGVLGPFGSSAAPLAVRIVSWVGFALLGYVFYRPMDPLATWAHRTLDLPRWALLIGTCLIATFPMSAAIIAIGSLPNAPSWPGLESATATYLSVLVIGGAVTAFFNLAKPGQTAPGPAPPSMAAAHPMPAPAAAPMPAPVSTAAPAPQPLFDQLPPELGSDIIALEMEDHYVRVHTALGSAQVHRSWWVSRGAVEDVLRDGRNVRLKLARGIEAPAARAKVSELRDARWL